MTPAGRHLRVNLMRRAAPTSWLAFALGVAGLVRAELFVSDFDRNRVLRCNGTNGSFMDVFVIATDRQPFRSELDLRDPLRFSRRAIQLRHRAAQRDQRTLPVAIAGVNSRPCSNRKAEPE